VMKALRLLGERLRDQDDLDHAGQRQTRRP
jgi:RNA polymerase sigma-70 factor (ECF subfamily)